MSNNIPICTIFSSISKVASMIATIFSLNGGLLTTSFVYTITILYLYIIESNKIICLSVLYLSSNGLVVSVLAPQPGHTKDSHKNGTNCLPVWHAGVRVGV